MAVSMREFARELRSFDARRVVMSELRTELRKLQEPIQTAVRAHALDTLPQSGGLNAWVAASRITVTVRTSGRRAGVIVKASRKSAKGKSDLAAIDRGRVRAPSWGRRSPAAWHTVLVTPGWFTVPVTDDKRLRDAADAALDRALDEIRRG